MSAEYSELKKLSDKFRKNAGPAEQQVFLEKTCKELAARLLRELVKSTPVGKYPKGTGKLGGTLRRGWTGGLKESAAQYMAYIPIERTSHMIKITLTNNVYYCEYVEYGHRTRGGAGWIKGKHFVKISTDDINSKAPEIIKQRLEQWLERNLK